MGAGKERYIGRSMRLPKQADPLLELLEDYWPCPDGLLVVNAIDAPLRDPINAMTVEGIDRRLRDKLEEGEESMPKH